MHRNSVKFVDFKNKKPKKNGFYAHTPEVKMERCCVKFGNFCIKGRTKIESEELRFLGYNAM
jgi:hypothetical protein